MKTLIRYIGLMGILLSTSNVLAMNGGKDQAASGVRKSFLFWRNHDNAVKQQQEAARKKAAQQPAGPAAKTENKQPKPATGNAVAEQPKMAAQPMVAQPKVKEEPKKPMDDQKQVIFNLAQNSDEFVLSMFTLRITKGLGPKEFVVALEHVCENVQVDVEKVANLFFEWFSDESCPEIRSIDAIIDNNWKTPLHFAVEGNNKALCIILLKIQADPHAKDRDGKSPLQIAQDKGFKEISAIFDDELRGI